MERSLARSRIYNILSLCFTYPDEGNYSWLSEGDWLSGLRELLTLLADEHFDGHLNDLEDASCGGGKALQLEMAREYTRLFINAFPHVIAPPYGSVYLEKDGRVFGKTTASVLRFFNDAGFDLKEDLGDLPDHIAHELEFMGILAGQESKASGAEKIRLEEIQLDFLSRFMIPWAPAFCKIVMEQSQVPFYRVLADLTQEFISFEKNYLGVPEEMDKKSKLNGG